MKNCSPVASKNRGTRSLTKMSKVNLPADYPWKVLNAYFNDHLAVFNEDEVALVTQIIRDRDIYAYLLLDELWGLQNTVSISPEEVDLYPLRVKYQMASLLKKFQFPTERSQRVATAKQKFFDAEVACAHYNHSGYQKLLFGETEYEAEVFTHFRSFLHKVLGDVLPPFAQLSEWSRHGPGANLDTCSGLISQYTKYSSWPYSCTRLALRHARLLIKKDKRWLGALEDDYRRKFNLPKYAILNQEVFWENVLSPVDHNRVTFVPKNALTERTIAIEPAMNLMLQLGVDGFIRRRLKRWGVDLDDQSKNQRLALYGSLDDSRNGFVTLDLKSASESIALKLVEIGCPSVWYDYFLTLRSPKWTFEGDEFSEYSKISSMGNGYTFALESLIFTAVIYAVMKVEGKGDVDTEKFSVFGDDLIVQKKYARGVIDLLIRCGLQLNLDKSFISGPTRESCGTDWFNGKPVRPIFLKELPYDCKALMNDRNRLLRNAVLYAGCSEPSTVTLIDKWIPEAFKTSEFIGPCSDTDFDTYLHKVGPVEKHWNRGAWVFARVVYKPRALNAENLFFRKLMHTLRPSMGWLGERVEFWKQFFGSVNGGHPVFSPKGRKVITGGSRFTVYRPNALAVSKISSRADVWCENYHF